MRPSGGSTPDMIDFAHDINVYKIWADMIAFGRSTATSGKDSYCGFIGRRYKNDFVLSHDSIMEKYGTHIRQESPVPDALSGAMGNYMYLACFDTEEELKAFYQDLVAVIEPEPESVPDAASGEEPPASEANDRSNSESDTTAEADTDANTTS